MGGEWLWGGAVPIVPRAPGLIWVLGPGAGDVMVDGRSAGDDSGRSVFGGPPPVDGSRDSCGSRPEDWLSSGNAGLGGTDRGRVR
jgi:hypothetical protein